MTCASIGTDSEASVRRLVLFILTIAIIVIGIRQSPLRAQSPDPMVLRRNVELTGGVWPGDFNGDGVTDLAGGSRVQLGNGDGTFKAPTDIGYPGAVLGVGDFNRDGKLDVVAAQGRPSYEVAVVLGNGDGTFGSSWHVSTGASYALSADLDGDGNRDVVLGNEDDVRVFQNLGTGSFVEVVSLPGLMFPKDGVIADVNGDGKRDILIGNHYWYKVSVFLNQGAFTFTAADVTFGGQANDVTAADFNGDGKLDLAIASASGGDGDWWFREGPRLRRAGQW
jgi:hypothetical protein